MAGARLALLKNGMCGQPSKTTFLCILQAGHDGGEHETERDLDMSDVDRLIEKFGLAIHGEEPAVVVTVLASFVQGFCEQQQIPIGRFIACLEADPLDPLRPEHQND